MKKYITLFMAVGCLLLALSDANSVLLGDVDLDGKIGLTEAVNALQVTAGTRTPLSASYVIVWKCALPIDLAGFLPGGSQIPGNRSFHPLSGLPVGFSRY